jgi:hypothetical protein
VVPVGLAAPVVINGVDVTGAVIEGEFGLYRPADGRSEGHSGAG